MPLRRFQASVGTSLTRAGKGKIKCGRPLSSPEAGESTPPQKKKGYGGQEERGREKNTASKLF